MLNLKKLWRCINVINRNQIHKTIKRNFIFNSKTKQDSNLIKINNNYKNFNFSLINNSAFLKIQKKCEIKKHRYFEKCNIIPKLENFFLILLSESKYNLYTLLKNEEFPFDPYFIINAYDINKNFLKDNIIEDLLNKIILSEKNLFSNITNKEQIFDIAKLFSNNYMENRNNPLGKKMMQVLKNKSYLMDKTDFLELIELFNENLISENVKSNNTLNSNNSENMDKILNKYADTENLDDPISKEMMKRKEHSDNKKIEFLEKEKINFDLTIEQKEKIHINNNNIKIQKDKIKFSLNLNKYKATIRSKYFKPKVYIYGINDNHVDNVLPVYDIVDRVETNVILFQERPVPKINQEDIYLGYFDKTRIKAYYKEILSANKEKYLFNKMEKIVILIM